MSVTARYLRAQVQADLATKMVFVARPRRVGKTTLAKSPPHASQGCRSWDIAEDRADLLAEVMPVAPAVKLLQTLV